MESIRDSAYQDAQFSMDIVCDDSTVFKTKKGRKYRIQWSQEKEWNKDPCLCKLRRVSSDHSSI